MKDGHCRAIRAGRRIIRLLTLGALFILLTVGAAAGERGADIPGGAPPSGDEVKLLRDQDYFPSLIDGIDHARREIVMTVFFFKTAKDGHGRPETVLAHLLEAARRGVRVDAIVERGRSGDNVTRDNQETAERMKQEGIRVCMDSPERTTHAKLFVIDRRVLFVGSHNLTQSALKYNHEFSVRIDSPALAEETLRYMKFLCP